MIIFTPDPDVVFQGRDESPSDHLVVKETWVENVYQINASDLLDTGVLIDIGANIGAVSVWGARLGDRVVAVEPDPDNRRMLETNLLANLESDQYQIIPYAAGPRTGTVHLEPGHGHSRIVEQDTGTSVVVDMIPLHEVYVRANTAYSDVLKIDIEGAEYALIAGTPSEILRKSAYITIEFDAAPDADFGALVSKLAHDFSIQVLGSPRRGGYLYCRRYDDPE